MANNRAALGELSSRYPGALIVMEAGCHSPWVSRHLEQAGCEVIVSNARKTRAIYQHERKSDRRDALMLARIARMEPALLYPVRHGSEEAQQDLLRIKLGDSLVRARVGLINSLRFTLKSLGYTIANPSTERFHKVIESALPESVVQMIAPRCKRSRNFPFGSRYWTGRFAFWLTSSIPRQVGWSISPESVRSLRSISF